MVKRIDDIQADPTTIIDRLERELKIGPYAHPYGFDATGLITEVRVEHEAWYRDNDPYGMPDLTERERAAEAEARRRWPYIFDIKGVS